MRMMANPAAIGKIYGTDCGSLLICPHPLGGSLNPDTQSALKLLVWGATFSAGDRPNRAALLPCAEPDTAISPTQFNILVGG